MQKLLDKYSKIFQLEATQGYENKAVMGGLQALASTWPSEAREHSVSENLIPVITSILNHYPNLEIHNRRQALIEIGDLLSIPNIRSLPEYSNKRRKQS